MSAFASGSIVRPARPRAGLAIGLLALLVLWMATRGYAGIDRDARFYAVQALARLEPGRFAEDLYFLHGSQDSFTVFSALYAPLVELLGLGGAHLTLFCLGHAIWLAALWWLASSLVPEPRLRLWSLASVLLLPPHVAVLGAAGYAEAFVTPRLFAEAAVLAALAAAARGHPVTSLFALAAAVLLHPLWAMPGIGAVCCLHLLRTPRLIAALGGVTVAAMAALPLLAATPPLAWARMDPAWFDLTRDRAFWCFILEWSPIDLAWCGTALVLGSLVVATLEGTPRRLMAAAMLTGIGGLLLTLFGADLARIQLIIAGQPWRATWLVVLLVNLLLPSMLARLRAEGALRDPITVAAWALLLACLAVGHRLLGGLAGTFPLALTCLGLALLSQRRSVTAPSLRLLGLVGFGLAAAWALLALGVTLAYAPREAVDLPWREVRAAALGMAALALLSLATRGIASRAERAGGWACGILILLAGGLSMDQRSRWTRFVEDPAAQRPALEAFLPDDGPAYWDGGVEILWLALRRPSYFSCAQGTGVPFFRETAIAFGERIGSFAFQNYDDECFRLMRPGSTPPTRDAIVAACRREPRLAHIVVQSEIPNLAPAARWRLPEGRRLRGSTKIQPAGEVFRHDCAILRNG